MQRLLYPLKTTLKSFGKHLKSNIIITVSLIIGLLIICIILSYVRSAIPMLQNYISDDYKNYYTIKYKSPLLKESELINLEQVMKDGGVVRYAINSYEYDKNIRCADNTYTDSTICYISKDYFNLTSFLLMDGRFLTADEILAGDKVCVVDYTLAKQNGIGVGDVIQAIGYELTVVGTAQNMTRRDQIFISDRLRVTASSVQQSMVVAYDQRQRPADDQAVLNYTIFRLKQGVFTVIGLELSS